MDLRLKFSVVEKNNFHECPISYLLFHTSSPLCNFQQCSQFHDFFHCCKRAEKQSKFALKIIIMIFYFSRVGEEGQCPLICIFHFFNVPIAMNLWKPFHYFSLTMTYKHCSRMDAIKFALLTLIVSLKVNSFVYNISVACLS